MNKAAEYHRGVGGCEIKGEKKKSGRTCENGKRKVGINLFCSMVFFLYFYKKNNRNTVFV